MATLVDYIFRSGINVSGQITSTVITGTAPFVISSTTLVPNLNVAALNGKADTDFGLVATGLSQFAATTSAELAGVISDETGSGFLVFNTSPEFVTSITTSSTSFDLLNTTATTVNAFGAATTLNLGAATGTTTIGNNLTVIGNLTINGTTTTANSTVVVINDPVFTLGGNTPAVNDSKDRGITFHWWDAADVGNETKEGFFGFNNSSQTFMFIPRATNTSEVFTGTLGGISVGPVNKVSITQPATGATLTLADGSSLITSGGNSLTLTTTDDTNVTFPEGTVTLIDDTYEVFLGTTAVALNRASGALSLNGVSIDGTAGSLATARDITATGDISWTVSFDGSANVSAAATLATVLSGETGLSTYNTFKVNSKGLIIEASNVPGFSLSEGKFNSYTITTTSVTPTPVYSIDITFSRSIEAFIQIESGSDYEVTKVLVIHDGTNVWISEYGTIKTNTTLGSFDAAINTGKIELIFTAASATSTTVKAVIVAVNA